MGMNRTTLISRMKKFGIEPAAVRLIRCPTTLPHPFQYPQNPDGSPSAGCSPVEVVFDTVDCRSDPKLAPSTNQQVTASPALACALPLPLAWEPWAMLKITSIEKRQQFRVVVEGKLVAPGQLS